MLNELGASGATNSFLWVPKKVRYRSNEIFANIITIIWFFIFVYTDKSLPAVALPVGEGRENLWGKTREAYRYVWENYRDKADWFMKADDDTYENVFISSFNNWRFYLCVCNWFLLVTLCWRISVTCSQRIIPRRPLHLAINSNLSLNKDISAVVLVCNNPLDILSSNPIGFWSFKINLIIPNCRICPE